MSGIEKEINKGINTSGKVLLALTGGGAIILTIISYPFISPALRKICLPFIPATENQIEHIFRLLGPARGTFVDLGSGDGRIVIKAAQRGFLAHGIELNPWLVLYSLTKSLFSGVYPKTTFICKDLWKCNLANYDNIVVFGVDSMMSHLQTKLLKECKNDCNIIACRFPLPNLIPTQTMGSGMDTAWKYVIKNK